MPPLIAILSSVLVASYCCYALPNPTQDGMDMPTGMGTPPQNTGTTPSTGGSGSSAAAAAAAAAAAGGGQNTPNCPPPSPPCPPPCPPPVNPCPSPDNPCPPPVNPCPPPVNPCPPPVNPCPPPVNPCPPPVNPCPPPVNPCPPPVNPCPPTNCSPSPNCPPGSTGSASAAAAASAAAGAGSASAAASASAAVSVQVPNLQQLCSYPTDVQQCSQVYSLRYQHTEFQKLSNKIFYIHYASKSQQQISFDSAPCFDFSCSQSCQTIMVKFVVESTTSISKIMWGADSSGQLSYVKTSVKVISQEYAVLQDTFGEAQKVTSGSTTAVVSSQTEQLQQFVSSSPYVLMYSDYEHILAMKRCSDSSMYVAVCETLYHNQQQLQANAMSAIQSIMSFHQIDMSMCSTLTQKFSLDISSISITSSSFQMSQNGDGTVTSGNKFEHQDGNTQMMGQTSLTKTQTGGMSMSTSAATNACGPPPTTLTCSPPITPTPPTGGSGAAAAAAAGAAAAT